MLETIRRYWIGLLVLVLVGLHASIVGVIRYQASMAKIDASCEVDLGTFLAYQSGMKNSLQMQLHAIVPLNHRMKSRQLIELNKAQVRQSLEEYLRQLDGKVLVDPYLSDLKSQLLEVLVQTLGESAVEDLVVTDVREASNIANIEFLARARPDEARKLVATLRSSENGEDSAAHGADGHGDAEHGDEEHGDSGHGEAEGSAGHGDTSHGESSAGHGAADKHKEAASGGHGAAAKSSSHGAKPAAKKSSGGHGAAPKKSTAKKSSGGH